MPIRLPHKPLSVQKRASNVVCLEQGFSVAPLDVDTATDFFDACARTCIPVQPDAGYPPLPEAGMHIERQWEQRKAWAFINEGQEVAWLSWRPGGFRLAAYGQWADHPGPRTLTAAKLTPQVREWANQALVGMYQNWLMQQQPARMLIRRG